MRGRATRRKKPQSYNKMANITQEESPTHKNKTMLIVLISTLSVVGVILIIIIVWLLMKTFNKPKPVNPIYDEKSAWNRFFAKKVQTRR